MSSEPIGASGLAGRYASALFELAEEQNAFDQVSEDLTRLQTMISESTDLRRLIESPVIVREDQCRAVDAVMRRADLSDLTCHFVGLVARNRRLFGLEHMIRAYRGLLAARRGETTAEVVSAVPLNDGQLAALEQALRQSAGSRVVIETSVDPDLLGGLIVKIGSRMMDSSLRSKLQKLQFVLKGAA